MKYILPNKLGLFSTIDTRRRVTTLYISQQTDVRFRPVDSLIKHISVETGKSPHRVSPESFSSASVSRKNAVSKMKELRSQRGNVLFVTPVACPFTKRLCRMAGILY